MKNNLSQHSLTGREQIYEALDGVEEVLRESAPDVFALALAESSVTIRVRWWIKPPRRIDDLRSRDQVITAIKQKLYIEHGIDLPYPTRQILFHDQTESTDGDRSQQREGWSAGKAQVPRSRSISAAVRKLADSATQANGRGAQTDPKQPES